MEKKSKLKKMFNRYTVLLIIMLILFSALGGKLYYLQVTSGQYYSDTANTKSHKLITVSAPRGFISDKNGVNLATDVQSYNIAYTDTDESGKTLFSTLQKVFSILDENKENQDDSFELKVNPYRFEFSTSDATEIQTLQLRFLKDRGFQDSILKKDFKGKKETDLTKSETSKLNDELLKLSPEYVYNTLVKKYGIIEGLKSINVQTTPENIRRYLLVKDGIKMNSFSGYKPVDIASNVSKNTSLIFQQRLSELPGINVDNQPMRQYPYGQLASSVLGYISKINPDDEEKYSEKGYDTSSDYVGVSGIEAALESKLKGDNGGEVVQVDKQGRVTNKLATREAAPGNNVQLTIDSNVQYSTEQALNNELKYLRSVGKVGTDQITTNATRGAAVVIDVHTGGVLALASLPSFNPNDFSNPSGLTEEQNQKYFNPDYESMAKAAGITQQSQIDARFPIDTSIKGNTTRRKDLYDFFPKYLYNYATMSLIPSGSTFKPLTAIAGLQSGVITPSDTYQDIGNFDLGGGHLDWFKSDGALGTVNVVSAIIKSSNPFFMNVGKLLRGKGGDDALAKYAWQFGLGADPKSTDPNAASTGIEIPENFGQVYNSYSQKNLSATQYLINIEVDLQNGMSGTNVKLPVIDLYDMDTDSKAVADIKTEIKNDIKDTVKNGTFSKDNYKALFKKLVDTDGQYKDKNITDAQLGAVADDVRYQALQTGHGSLSLPYNMYFASIGQGMDNFTPLQLANYVATIANGGTRYKVHLVDKVTDSTGKVVLQNQPTVIDKADMSAETRQLVMAGMEGVTGTGGGGTDGTAASTFKGFPINTGGKTGTAEFNMTIQDQVGRSDYAWYVGFAPADNPQIAVSVVIFDGGYGSEASKVAKGIYEGYFKDELQKLNYPLDIDVNAKPEN
jgi:penicillin-binding protein 2